MAQNMDTTPNAGGEAPFVSFTKTERIQQLGEIDQSIVSLLRTVGRACESLAKTDTNPVDATMGSGNDAEDDETDVFQVSVKEFFRTLHSVDVRIKRQVWGLEEAGIVSLGKEDTEDEPSKTKTKPSALQPDGDGKIGGFDAGWLNSRSSKVERDMESELWEQAEAFLDKMFEKRRNDDSEGTQMAQ